MFDGPHHNALSIVINGCCRERSRSTLVGPLRFEGTFSSSASSLMPSARIELAAESLVRQMSGSSQ
jgi:hypothetical protein